MARRNRLDFIEAFHLVTVSGYPGGNVFYDPLILSEFPGNPRKHGPHAEHFERLLWDTCEQYGAQVHAYSIEPNTALLIIQRRAAPLSWIMHDLLGRYSKYLGLRSRVRENPKTFPRRYTAQLLQPAKLPYAVRYIQRRAPVPNSRRRPINHPFSSGPIYSRKRPRPDCFVVSATHNALERLGYIGDAAYFEFMARADSPAVAHMLVQNIIGEKLFVESAQEQSRYTPIVPSPDEILGAVAHDLLHTDPQIACSPTHRGALTRALVAWYAMRAGTAQIGTVSAWFGVTSTDLRYLIRRHRQKTPQYFYHSLPGLLSAQYTRQQARPAPVCSPIDLSASPPNEWS